ncbi:MAG TPA: PEP-CTERM-box response regulator transcription factor [Steroidobacteraceae bacterium]|nr:PEP-CTERM-box response regulator transcription factor [Steroidobacteraceae bacterium]
MTSNENWTRRLLIVEDDAALRSQLKWSFEGFELFFAENRQQAIAALRQHEPQVVLQDLGLPPDAEGTAEGFATLSEILELAPATKVIVVTGNHDRGNAIKAVANGAYDFYEKPVDADILRLLVGRAFHIARLEQEVEQLRRRTAPQSFEGIIAVDRGMQNVCRVIEKVAPANVAVLILGESGTGKELLSRAIHNLSGRADKRFIAINCAAIPENLLEAELFGYEKGAFTGAAKTTPGKVEYADGGTLFLDEVGDMPLPLQAKLLRFLQNKVIERVGGRHEIPVDVRIVSATNQNIETQIREQRFRQDLYYRLGEVTVNVPPLRDRPGDVLAIAQAVLARYSRERGGVRRGFTDDALQMLTSYNWPGNVRELENKVKVACLLGDDPMVSALDLNLAGGSGPGLPLNLKEVRNRAEREALGRAIAASAGNISRAAELLGVSRPTLYDLLARHELTGTDKKGSPGLEVAGGAA